MSKNENAQKGQGTNTPLVIVSDKSKGGNSKIVNLKNNAEEANLSTPPPVDEKEPIIEKVALSIEEIKRKNEVLSRLTAKWDALAEKRRRVENFSISHDADTANVIVRDSNGEVFESNSPKTIGRLLEFWKEEFSTALAQVEKDMREIA